MRVALLAPPGGSLTYPPLSLPTLAAFLRSRGHQVCQCDVGIQCMDRMLSNEYLRFVRRLALRRASENPAGNDASRKKHRRMLQVAAVAAEDTLRNIERAKAILRSSGSFFDRDQYLFAAQTVRNALTLISAAFFPFDLEEPGATFGRPLTFENLRRVSGDRRGNPFLPILRDSILPRILSQAPEVIGISVTYSDQLFSGLTLARIVKRLSPQTLVVMGGAGVMNAEAGIRRCARAFEWVDSYVFGEGETALSTLLDLVRSGSLHASPLNKLYLASDRDGRRARKPASFSAGERERFNDLPTPDYDGLNRRDYLAPETVFLLSSARGCYYRKCAFCNVSAVFRDGFQQRSMDRLSQDIETLRRKHGARWIFFADDCVPPSRCREIADCVRRAGKPLYWMAEVRFEKGFTRSLLDEMRSGGCRQLIFGNESGNQRVLDLMRKGTRLPMNKRIIRDAHRAGIAVHLQNFLGFPGETPEEARDTIEFLVSERERVTSCSLGVYRLLEGSPVQTSPARFGIRSLRRRNAMELAPRYGFTLAAGAAAGRLEEIWERSYLRLRSAYPRSLCFLDGPLGAHAFFHLAQSGAVKFEEVFPFEPIPAEITDYRPKLKPSVRRVPLNAKEIILYDRGNGAWCACPRREAARLSGADGGRSIGQLVSELTRKGPSESNAEYLERARRLVRMCLRLVRSGFLELCPPLPRIDRTSGIGD